MKPDHTAFIEGFDSSDYDTKVMRIDARNGNFSPERAEEYRHENIVQASILNGQHSQARRQCAAYGLDYGTQRRALEASP